MGRFFTVLYFIVCIKLLMFEPKLFYDINKILCIHVHVFIYSNYFPWLISHRTHGLIVSVLTWSAVDREFKHWSSQTKDFKISICCLSANHAALKNKSKD
jgi:hypothetical protein